VKLLSVYEHDESAWPWLPCYISDRRQKYNFCNKLTNKLSLCKIVRSSVILLLPLFAMMVVVTSVCWYCIWQSYDTLIHLLGYQCWYGCLLVSLLQKLYFCRRSEILYKLWKFKDIFDIFTMVLFSFYLCDPIWVYILKYACSPAANQ
jgi:hypothetical protein